MTTARKARATIQWLSKGWQPIAIGYVPSRQAWAAECERMNGTDETRIWPFDANPGAQGRVQVMHRIKSNTVTSIVIFIDVDNCSDFADLVGIAVHEATHVWQYVCIEIGEKQAGKEIEAYALQQLTISLINAIVRCHPRIRKLKWS